jgi:hypothetical protein
MKLFTAMRLVPEIKAREASSIAWHWFGGACVTTPTRCHLL